MGMCKECGNVYAASEMENGVCKYCRDGVVKEKVAVSPQAEVPETEESAIVYNNNIFSFRGRMGRLHYLLSGILLTYGLVAAGWYLALVTEAMEIIYVGVLGALYVGLTALIKRARDTGNNVGLMIIVSLIPYIGFLVMLYLLLVPSTKKELRSGSLSSVLLIVFFIILLGIMAAVAIPKLSDQSNEELTQKTSLQAKVSTLESDTNNLERLDQECTDDKQEACDQMIEMCDKEDNGRACGMVGYQALLESIETDDEELAEIGIVYLKKGCEDLKDTYSCLMMKTLVDLSDEAEKI